MHQGPVVATREIRSAYRAGKHTVADQREAVADQADVARRMTGRMAHLERAVANLNQLAVLQFAVGLRRLLDLKTEG